MKPIPEAGPGWQTIASKAVNALIRRLTGGGATADRPDSPIMGQAFYDETLKRPLWYNTDDDVWRGAEGKRQAVTKTADFTQAVTEWTIINNKSGSSCVATLLNPATYKDETLHVMNMQAQTLTSASSNVCPIGSATAGTAILPNTATAWAILRSDGTYWRIIARGT